MDCQYLLVNPMFRHSGNHYYWVIQRVSRVLNFAERITFSESYAKHMGVPYSLTLQFPRQRFGYGVSEF